VIFDWAGTTVDFGSLAPAAVFLEVFQQNKVEITMHEAREPMGMHKRDHIRCILDNPAVRERWLQAHDDAPTEADVQKLYDQFIPLQVECIARYADPVPGCVETVAALRERAIKIGSNTGYNRQMMDVLAPVAAARGFQPESIVCASDVPRGRPAPWMCLENARQLDVYPMEAVVKVDDTVPGILEGLNAGMWTVAVARTGNEMGLSIEEIESLPGEELQARLECAHRRLAEAGAHYVVDGVADLMPVIDDIEERLSQQERP
jgi:phosphonoacetaldehyde hydrolase